MSTSERSKQTNKHTHTHTHKRARARVHERTHDSHNTCLLYTHKVIKVERLTYNLTFDLFPVAWQLCVQRVRADNSILPSDTSYSYILFKLATRSREEVAEVRSYYRQTDLHCSETGSLKNRSRNMCPQRSLNVTAVNNCTMSATNF